MVGDPCGVFHPWAEVMRLRITEGLDDGMGPRAGLLEGMPRRGKPAHAACRGSVNCRACPRCTSTVAGRVLARRLSVKPRQQRFADWIPPLARKFGVSEWQARIRKWRLGPCPRPEPNMIVPEEWLWEG